MVFSKKNIFMIVIIGALAILYIYELSLNNNIKKSENHKKIKKEDKIKDDAKYVKKNYFWKYAGKKYGLSLKFNNATYFYYTDKSIYPYRRNGQVNYSNFLQYKHTNIFSKLASKLRDKAKNNNLNDDQLAELTVSFVQALPYDKMLRNKIVNNDAQYKHPYEVLYKKSGTCSGKSFLTTLLLNKLNYGTCLFRFKEAKHMMAGISCPDKYSSFNSGYCYIESTSYFPIALSSKDFNKINLENITTKYSANLLRFFSIHNKSKGKSYHKVKMNRNMIDSIINLSNKNKISKNKLKIKKEKLTRFNDQLKDLKSSIKRFKNNKSIHKYNAYVKKYNDLVPEFKSIKDQYDRLRKKYNRNVNKYNTLVNRLLIQKGN